MTEKITRKTDEDIAVHLLAQGLKIGTASLTVELTRSLTGGDFGLYEQKYPPIFKSPVWARWTLDLAARTAEYLLYPGGEPTGSEPREHDNFHRVARIEVEDVGKMPLSYLVRQNYPFPYDNYDLMVADRDWACDLFAVREGEHFVRFTSYERVPAKQSTYYRVGKEVAERVVARCRANPAAYDEDIAYALWEEHKT